MKILSLVVVILFFCVCHVEAAWPNARWRRPKWHPELGDLRGVFNHFQKHEHRVPFPADPNPPLMEQKRKSRSYHFKYGPIYPTHHTHLKDADVLHPGKHQLWHP